MSWPLVADTSEFYRVDAARKLDPRRRAELGQYMTPAPVARFMASLFSNVSGDIRLLDPGAGVGSLTAAFAERLCAAPQKPRSAALVVYEFDPALTVYLRDTLNEAATQCRKFGINVITQLYERDFILDFCQVNYKDMLRVLIDENTAFTHVIMNPPYKKIHSRSKYRFALREAGLETSNIYAGFMYIAAVRLRRGGELVAIVPRSFCNGPYFKHFREKFFEMMSIHHIHVFNKRNTAFNDDKVLQENIIIHAIKGVHPSEISITSSSGGDFLLCSKGYYAAEDMTECVVPYSSVLNSDDANQFVHIVTNDLEQAIMDRMACFTATLADIGVQVSTGPVVDFRLKADLRREPEEGAVPLLYATHFRHNILVWPKKTNKPNAIRVSPESRRWLWKNEGHYVITKRFTAKEERRRIVAWVYPSSLPGELIGFENHLNVFHIEQAGLPRALARGLSVYLNSSIVDAYFRLFNGHTQVNATDLRALRYPHRDALERIGQQAGEGRLSQEEIDAIVDGELSAMADNKLPLNAQRKIEEALRILSELGMPRAQQNERSALTLLALLNLKPSGTWGKLERPLMGITPIMDFVRRHYGRGYAPNTRETFRRQTMHQFVEAGIAVYNPDDPGRPVNSPRACYQISEEAYDVISAFGTGAWQAKLKKYLEDRSSLAEKWAKNREMQRIPVYIADEVEIRLTPGSHSDLIEKIITEFAERFTPGAEVIYVGDTGDKTVYFREERLAALGVAVDRHGKMPDIVLYLEKENWLILVEAVTSHGPVDAKRHGELAALFEGSRAGLIYVTAFPDRRIMSKFLSEISWETEVWCADAPSHLIHFDGERFLGPYKNDAES